MQIELKTQNYSKNLSNLFDIIIILYFTDTYLLIIPSIFFFSLSLSKKLAKFNIN